MFETFIKDFVSKIYYNKSEAFKSDVISKLTLILESKTSGSVPYVYSDSGFLFTDKGSVNLDEQVLRLVKVLRYLGNINFRKYNGVVVLRKGRWLIKSKNSLKSFLDELVRGTWLSELSYFGYVLCPKSVDPTSIADRAILSMYDYLSVSSSSTVLNYLQTKEGLTNYSVGSDNFKELMVRILSDSYFKGFYRVAGLQYTLPLLESIFECLGKAVYYNKTFIITDKVPVVAEFTIKGDGRIILSKNLSEISSDGSLVGAFLKTFEVLNIFQTNLGIDKRLYVRFV